MASKLKARLKELTAQDESLQVLLHQWGFDERLVGRALQSVADTFKHYSLHDESHSLQILVNIERVLGRRGIEQLGASDIWMLLETAYLHDIGMVVPYAEKEKLLADQTLVQFLAEDDSLEAKRILESLKSKDELTAVEMLELHEGFNQILAERFRKIHPDKSEHYCHSPGSINLASPRTHLIPERIWKLIGRICKLHGRDFDEVMELPQKQVGIGNDDIHPRLIACLLRLGDLLDIDNNRFCPVMCCLTGHAPSSTKAHQDKHHSVQFFNLDNNKVDATAICQTEEGYDATRSWFDYLEQELTVQTMRWSDIRPSEAFPALPGVGELNVGLVGYDLNGRDRPKFNLASERALEILSGNNIYSSKYACIRELLQNALDATLIRIWLEEFQHLDLSKRTIERLVSIGQKYPISIELKSCGSVNEAPSDKSVFRLVIRDVGVGFDATDLTEFQTVGISAVKRNRYKIIKNMPAFMRPTSSFGIGFQSVFMLSDEINISSRSALSHFNKNIKITRRQNGVVLQVADIKQEAPEIRTPGVEIELKLVFDKVPKKFSVRMGRWEGVERFDPVFDTTWNVEIQSLMNEILAIAWQIPVPLLVNGAPQCNRKNFTGMHFSEDGEVLLEVLKSSGRNFRHKIYFKWFELEDGSFNIPANDWIEFNAYVFGYHAHEIVDIGRRKLNEDIKGEVHKKILNSLLEVLRKMEVHEEMQAHVDALFVMNGLETRFYNAHYNLLVGGVSIGELLSAQSITVNIHENARDGQGPIVAPSTGGYNVTIKKPHFSWGDREFDLLLKILPEHFTKITVSMKGWGEPPDQMPDEYEYEIVYQKEGGGVHFDMDNLMVPILKRLRENNDFVFLKRHLMPCPDEFQALALRDDELEGYLKAYGHSWEKLYIFDSLLFPFVLEKNDGDWGWVKDMNSQKTIEYAFRFRKNEEITMGQFKKCYEDYIDRIDALL